MQICFDVSFLRTFTICFVFKPFPVVFILHRFSIGWNCFLICWWCQFSYVFNFVCWNCYRRTAFIHMIWMQIQVRCKLRWTAGSEFLCLYNSKYLERFSDVYWKYFGNTHVFSPLWTVLLDPMVVDQTNVGADKSAYLQCDDVSFLVLIYLWLAS